MSSQSNHSVNRGVRLIEARSRLIPLKNNGETLEEGRTHHRMARLSEIKRLIEDAKQCHTRLLCDINGNGMNKNEVPHYDSGMLRIANAQALMIAGCSDAPINLWNRAIMASALLGIEALVSEPEREFDGLFHTVRAGEVLV